MLGGYVAGGHRARALLVQPQLGDIARMHADGYQFEIEQDIDDILLHALDGRVLMQHAFDGHFRDCRSRQGRQQHAAQGIAQRVTETAFKRFDHNARMAGRHGMYFDDPRLQKFIDRSLHGYHLR